MERVNRTLSDKLHRYFTYKNTYKYIDVLPKFVKGYNATVHSTTGMAPADVSDTDVLTMWNKICGKEGKTQRLSKLKFRVGQHVRISKEKMKFAKGSEKITPPRFSKYVSLCTEPPVPCSNSRTCEAKRSKSSFYSEELVLVRITKQTTYKIDKILDRRVRRGILE